MKYLIITGTSKGIGKALAESLIENGNALFCISRSKSAELIKKSIQRKIDVYCFEYDLNNIHGIENLMNEIFSAIDIKKAQGIYLINNAGILDPMKQINKCSPEEIEMNINVNLTSPIILTSLFLQKTKGLNAKRRIINISSGAGKRPVEGWSCYCASKAGIDLFTQAVALEQKNENNPAEIISFAPGVVDTGMQKEIRSANEEDFPNVKRFIELKKGQKLLTPEYVALKIKELLFSTDFNQGGVIRIDENKKIICPNREF